MIKIDKIQILNRKAEKLKGHANNKRERNKKLKMGKKSAKTKREKRFHPKKSRD